MTCLIDLPRHSTEHLQAKLKECMDRTIAAEDARRIALDELDRQANAWYVALANSDPEVSRLVLAVERCLDSVQWCCSSGESPWPYDLAALRTAYSDLVRALKRPEQAQV